MKVVEEVEAMVVVVSKRVVEEVAEEVVEVAEEVAEVSKRVVGEVEAMEEVEMAEGEVNKRVVEVVEESTPVAAVMGVEENVQVGVAAAAMKAPLGQTEEKAEAEAAEKE